MLPPGPRAPSIVQLLHFTQRPLPWLDDCARRYGDPFTARFFGLGTFVLVAAPGLIKQVFTGDPEVLHAGKANAIVEPVVGRNSVLLLDGAPHLRQRRLLLPPLRGERMFAYARLMAEITSAAIERMPLERFRPERFLDARIDPYAWLPFGGGIRRCLGMAFALYEMKIVVGLLWSRLRLRLASPGPVPVVRRTITLAPAGGTRVIVVERRPAAPPIRD